MARKKSRQEKGATKKSERYTDNADHVGGYADENDSSSEEEIMIIHESDKQRVRRKARAAKAKIQEAVQRPSFRTMCWRYFLFAVVVVLGVAMIIQLYSSYGEFLTDQIFPPRVSSGGVACGNGTITKDYMLGFDKYVKTDNATTEGWLHLNATQPKDSLEWAWRVAATPQEQGKEHAQVELLDAHWTDKETLRVWLPSEKECAKVLVFSV